MFGWRGFPLAMQLWRNVVRNISVAGLCLCLSAHASSASAAAPAPARPSPATTQDAAGADTCGLRYYRFLIGKPMEEARNVSGEDYRVVTDANSGTRNPKRLTVLIERGSNIIQKVMCG